MQYFVFSRLSEKIQEMPFLNYPKKEPEDPIRAELFSIERLEQHAESLARAQSVTLKHSRGSAILGRVKENRRVLNAAHRNITQTVR